MSSAGPLDPDPFASRYTLGWAAPTIAIPYYRFPHWPWSAVPVDFVTSSVSLVTYIRPGELPGMYRVFGDDGVDDQPQWLSDAFQRARYRLAAGLRMHVATRENMHFWPTSTVTFAKANPTTFRGLALPRFRAPIEYASPNLLIPPPSRHSDELCVAGVHVRSKNGFLSRRVGLAVARVLGYTPDRIPQIGVSGQIWTAADGCKCIAAAHNFFPAYELYIDGVRFRWDVQPDFQEFDAYNLPVEWRAFFVLYLHDALRRFPLIQSKGVKSSLATTPNDM